MVPHILVIEDDPDFQEYLVQILNEQTYVVSTANTGLSGLRTLEKSVPDLVVLDLTLPDITGESVCASIRKQYPEMPIVILTGKDAVADKVRGLSMGADDYITKPFATAEFLARVKARLRTENGNETLKVGDLELNTTTIEVKRGDTKLTLTPQEFKLLEYLMRNSGKVLTRDMILNRIWLYSPDIESRVVDVYIGYLRKKIDAGQKKKLIHSVRGFGYTMKEE
jgi:two-component system response regulator MprA